MKNQKTINLLQAIEITLKTSEKNLQKDWKQKVLKKIDEALTELVNS